MYIDQNEEDAGKTQKFLTFDSNSTPEKSDVLKIKKLLGRLKKDLAFCF